MAAPRNGDSPAPRREHSCRRSHSSSPARSYPVPSRSPSPRRSLLRNVEERRDLDRARSRENAMTRYVDRDRDREKYGIRKREMDVDRVRRRDRGRNRDHVRDRRVRREEETTRDRRSRDRQPLRSRDRRGKDGPVKTTPFRSPERSRRDRSISPLDLPPGRRRSLSRSPPRHQTIFKHVQRTNIGMWAARDEDGVDAKTEGTRGEVSAQEDHTVVRIKEVEAALDNKETTKEQPSFEYSGKLAAETNKVKGVTLQFTEPPEARKPTTRWRLYVFKDGEPLNDPLYIHRQTCYLFGRERRVADIPTDHPSCSKQHAVIQYRLTDKKEANGITSNKVRPYVMDLGSTNGTMLNGERLDSQRYYEMFEKDTIKFGNSSREYVLLHEHSIG